MNHFITPADDFDQDATIPYYYDTSFEQLDSDGKNNATDSDGNNRETKVPFSPVAISKRNKSGQMVTTILRSQRTAVTKMYHGSNGVPLVKYTIVPNEEKQLNGNGSRLPYPTQTTVPSEDEAVVTQRFEDALNSLFLASSSPSDCLSSPDSCALSPPLSFSPEFCDLTDFSWTENVCPKL